jgi:S1-C subfamily serine protease
MAGSIVLFLTASFLGGEVTPQKIRACTVQVACQKDYGTQRIARQGSGIVVGEDGLIVTCWHVVAECRSIEVRTSDGRKFPARIIGSEPKQDLALIETSRRSNFYLPAVDQSQPAAPGDATYVAGYAGDVQCSIVDATIRGAEKRVEMLHVAPGTPLLRFEGPVRPGFSGGPIVHSDGRLLGVVIGQSRWSPEDGFAVPDSAVLDLLRATGKRELPSKRRLSTQFPRTSAKDSVAATSAVQRILLSQRPLAD